MNIFKKNINLYSLLFGCIILGTLSCSQEDLGSFIPKDPNLTFGQSDTMLVTKDAADYEVSVTTNLPWRVKTDADWIVLNTQRGLESDTVSFSVAKNPTTQPRTAKLIAWITSEYQNVIVIRQEAGDPLPDSSVDYYVKKTGSVDNDGLAWEKSTTLDKALGLAGSNDRIHIAVGTYVPETVVTGGSASDNGDKTFEIKANVILIGGYPADASAGAVVNASVNKVVLSGAFSGANAYHVVTITAPQEENRKVIFNNIDITGGKAAATGTAALSINGLSYIRLNGGAMIIGRAVAVFNGCRIYENQSLSHTPGVYVFAGSNVTFNGCSIDNNKGLSASGGNGGGLWNDASTVYLINSSVSSNENSGVAAGIYAYNASTASKTYLYNTTIEKNKAPHKTGYYGRENSEAVMVNCTVSGNYTTSASNTGAGVCLYANATKSKLDLISCTITNNISAGTADAAGGVRINDANCTLNIYNTIISGNISNGTTGDIYGPATATYTKSFTIISNKVYDNSGIEVAGKVFDYTTMLAPLAKNGGQTSTCLLTGENNPAVTLGMSSAQLLILGIGYDPMIAEGIITFDQTGLTRSGKTTIGACVK